jgi:hypothetical protein
VFKGRQVLVAHRVRRVTPEPLALQGRLVQLEPQAMQARPGRRVLLEQQERKAFKVCREQLVQLEPQARPGQPAHKAVLAQMRLILTLIQPSEDSNGRFKFTNLPTGN